MDFFLALSTQAKVAVVASLLVFAASIYYLFFSSADKKKKAHTSTSKPAPTKPKEQAPKKDEEKRQEKESPSSSAGGSPRAGLGKPHGLSDEEVDEVFAHFSQVDSVGSGMVDEDEFREVIDLALGNYPFLEDLENYYMR